MAGKRKAGASGSEGPTGSSGRPAGTSGPGGAPGPKTPLVRTKRQAGKLAKQEERAARAAAPKVKRTAWQRIRRVALYLVLLGLIVVLVAAGGFLYLYKTTDLPAANGDFETETTFVYYSDGSTELGKYAVQNRDAITYDEMPQDIKDAAVAAENRTFFTDNGLDLKGILRAAFSNAAGNSTQGASTITQQYIKILYLSQERTYQRKLKEAILSLKLKRQMSKQEILEGYLNTIYFGRGAYGIQAAALAYFDKPAAELSLKECAALASIINNPTNLDPDNGKDAKKALRERYAYVLDGMAKADDITSEEATTAAKRLPKFPPIAAESTYGGQKGHVLTMVKDQLLGLTNEETGEPFTESEIDGGGLRVTTTFTKKAMDAAADGVAEARPEGFSDKELHIGVASVQVDTGAIRGIYAGQDYLESQINWAIAGGQAGSSMKPFALAAGLKAGYSLKDTFDGNSPFTLDDGTEIRNEQDTNYGSAVNLLQATEDSINTAYTDLTVSMPDGPQSIMDMMNAMGIPPEKAPKKDAYGFPDHTPGLQPFPSITLGSATVSPINMASAYATIANGGRYSQPYLVEKVVGKDGETLYDHTVSDKQVIDQDQGSDIAADVSYALQQVVSSGTGTAALGLGRPAAGKTGTATNDKDQVDSAWFTGYTPQLATSVMYVRGKGNEQLDGWLPSYFGGSYPAQTWTAVMTHDMDGVDEEEFPEPAYLDGEAPDAGHTPTYAPPPPSNTPKPTRTPSETPKPSDKPTPTQPTAPPTTQAPPTPTEVPTTAPPTSEAPPTPTDVPTTPPPTATDTPNPTQSPSARVAARTSRQAVTWWARFLW